MALDPSFVGRSYGPTEPYRVSREKVREFATAIGDDGSATHDVEHARSLGHPDLVASPTFPTVLAFRSMGEVVADPALGLDYARVVHREERYAYLRSVFAGDELVVTMTVDGVRSMAGNDVLTLRAEVATDAGEPVLTGTTVIVARAA